MDGPGMENDNAYSDIMHIESIDEVIKKGKPVIIDFGADWCGPCRAFHPTLEKIAEKYNDVAYIKYVDVDKQPYMCENFPVQAIPTQVFITKDGNAYKPSSSINVRDIKTVKNKMGEKVTYHVSALSEKDFEEILKDMGAF